MVVVVVVDPSSFIFVFSSNKLSEIFLFELFLFFDRLVASDTKVGTN